MKLPIGVYVVSEAFRERSGTVTFSFQGQQYEAEMNLNALASLDELTHMEVRKAEAPFCGYEDITVVIFPVGTYMLGTSQVRIEKFRTYFPYSVAILGENVGISPNEADLRTKAVRQEESVLDGAFYFGTLAMEGAVDGRFIVDGFTVHAKIYDERTAGEHAALEVKNCIFQPKHTQHLILAGDFAGTRSTLVQDCRFDGVDGMCGEGNILCIESGKLTARRLYVGNTSKFLGMTNYSKTRKNALTKLELLDCLFERSESVHGLTVNLPQDGPADIWVENCQFLDFTPENDPAITAVLPKGSKLTVKASRFAGTGSAPAILVDGSMDGVTAENCAFEGFYALTAAKPPRRACMDGSVSYPLVDPHTPVCCGMAALDALYAGKQLYFGDFHCHSNSGGTSDGETPIENYIPDMQKLGLDFAAIVDHKQMRHFFLPCWDEKYLLCGTEPGCALREPNRPPLARKMDYTMIFPDKTGLAKVLKAFPRFAFTGTQQEGSYKYVGWSVAELRELADYVYSIGGLLSHAHPKQLMVSDDPLDYYISDLVPLETVQKDPDCFSTRQNRELWTKLLALGKRVRTHGSSDSHGPVSNRGLTAVYAPRHFSTDIFNAIRAGDCVAGGVGIQMSIDDAPMGSVTDFADGKKLYIRVADFHFAHKKPDTVYCLKVYTDKGLAYAREFTPDAPPQVVLPVQKRLFYRVEITNESDDLPVAISNPIWINE